MSRPPEHGPESPEGAVARAFTEFDAAQHRLLRVLPPQWRLACTAGCDHCCAQQVSVTAPEALEIAALLRDTLSEVQLEATRGRIREVADRVRGRSAAEHRGTMCPLNVDGRCSVYAARPLLCRGANSFDAGACARRGAPIPTYAALWDAAQTLQEQLDAVAVGVTGRREMLELCAAVLVALEHPDAHARWRAGEPIFAPAVHAWFDGDVLREWTPPT